MNRKQIKSLAAYTFICVIVLVIYGCDAKFSKKTDEYRLPPELSDCSIYYLTNANWTNNLTVVRCPSAVSTSTHYRVAKHRHATHVSISDE